MAAIRDDIELLWGNADDMTQGVATPQEGDNRVDVLAVACLAGLALIPAMMWRVCERCNGGGFVATKHGPVRCPMCKGEGGE